MSFGRQNLFVAMTQAGATFRCRPQAISCKLVCGMWTAVEVKKWQFAK